MNAQILKLIIMVLGLVLYFVPATSPPATKVNEAGRVAFFAGLLAFLLGFHG